MFEVVPGTGDEPVGLSGEILSRDGLTDEKEINPFQIEELVFMRRIQKSGLSASEHREKIPDFLSMPLHLSHPTCDAEAL